ncbi:hypothetical protein [Rhodococcus erythropolis]|uniref:hypothetical protein n=1 Tax=Rhodococcus erythropolis TaxID=1833 RepID=UPI0022B4978C|nr:hypothetical protein [Rhodococcus erythropolis]MCZ4566984.1 hypothetical protein [Rhodococcus erythropolis]
MLTEVSERQRPVEDGGVRLFGVEAVEKSFEVLVTDLDEARQFRELLPRALTAALKT